MVVVANFGRFWIEEFQITSVSLATVTNRVSAHTLEKPGIFMAGGATIIGGIGGSIFGLASVAIRNTDNTDLVAGDDITAFESIVSNGSAGSLTLGQNVWIMLRKKGR